MRTFAAALCVLLLGGSSAFAQSKPASSDTLPVDLGRIRLQLTESAPKKPVLKIQQVIEVIGVAPPIELWTPQEQKQMLQGPVPWAPPTQKDILDLTTPQEFKSYPMDLNALMAWLAEKLNKKE